MSMEELAVRVGAHDLFVLRHIASDRLFNTDGFGRGAGWAGNVAIDPAFEPWIAGALGSGLVRKHSGVPFRAFGPYWASSVAAVKVGDDLVVFGGGTLSEADDDLVVESAHRASAQAHPVSSEKSEADEAEVRQALEALGEVERGSIGSIARHLASVTARALSCEFGAVLLTGPPVRIHVAEEGWRPAASDDEMIAALMPLVPVAKSGMFVEQDLSESPFPYRPLSFADGLVARCVVPIGPEGRLGLLVAAHAGTAPRGFTELCQRVARTMGEAGEPLLASARVDE